MWAEEDEKSGWDEFSFIDVTSLPSCWLSTFLFIYFCFFAHYVLFSFFGLNSDGMVSSFPFGRNSCVFGVFAVYVYILYTLRIKKFKQAGTNNNNGPNEKWKQLQPNWNNTQQRTNSEKAFYTNKTRSVFTIHICWCVCDGTASMAD